jgi:hypothetical protein
MVQSIHNLQYNERYCGSVWLTVGIVRHLLVEVAFIEFFINLFKRSRGW